MGEEQLAEVLIEFLLPLIDRKAHVPETEPLEPGTGDTRGDDALQRHERPVQLRHRVAQGRRQAVAVPGGAGGRIADAAGGQDDRIRGIGLPFPPDGADRAVLHFNVQCPVVGPADLKGFQPLLQGGTDVKGPIRHREDPVPPLHLQGDAEVLEEGHGVPASPAGKCAVKEFSVAGDIGKKALERRVIRDVAAALSGNVQLLPQALVGLQQRDAGAALRCRDGSHHTGRPPADDCHPLTHRRPFRRHRTRPRCPPDGRRWRPHPCPSAGRWPREAH